MRIQVLNRRLRTTAAFIVSASAFAGAHAAHAQTANKPGIATGIVEWTSGSNNGPASGVIANTSTDPSNGVFATGAGTAGTVSGATISVSGTSNLTTGLSSGIRSGIGATVSVTDSTIDTQTGRYTRGLFAEDATINSSNTAVTTRGANSHAVHALDQFSSGTASVILNGGTLATFGSDSFGIYAQNSSVGSGASVTASNVGITTSGTNGFGLFAYNAGVVNFTGGSIATSGSLGHGAVAGLGSTINISDSSIVTSASGTSGAPIAGLIADQNGAVINADNVDITTNGLWAFGAYAKTTGSDTSSITLNGGSITTAQNIGEGVYGAGEARAFALYANGAGATISATGTDITTVGRRSYGAYALAGGKIALSDIDISTRGFMGYGIYASGAGSVLTANNVNITTTGQVGDGVWAYNGGIVNINGGVLQILGEQSSAGGGEATNGLIAVGGNGTGTTAGTINASNLSILTTGANSSGVTAGADIGLDETFGNISLSGSIVRAEGAGSVAAKVIYGSSLNATNSSLTSVQGAGIELNDSAAVNLVGTTVSAGQQTFASTLSAAGQTQTITVGNGSVATVNNGTLLSVTREDAGTDGAVNLTLGAGSTTSGDIVDIGTKTGNGGTSVIVEANATFTGQAFGVTNFQSAPGGDVTFEGEAQIEGDLSGQGTTFTFSQEGGNIGGDVLLSQGSSTTGGSIENPVNVEGDVAVDQTSVFGGNWNIEGDVDNAGTINPGNSIGIINIGGNLTLSPTSVYAVEVDATGASDRVNVGGTALLDGTVSVAPLGGFLLQTPYTILTAGSLGGTTFDGVSFTQSSAFVAPTLAYDPTTVTLTIARNDVRFASVAETANEAGVAEAIDGLPLTGGIANAVAFGTVDQARGAFNSLSGEVHASLKTGLIEDSRFVRDTATSRIRSAFGGPASAMTTSGPNETPDPVSAFEPQIWGQAFGSWGQTDGDGNAAELDRDTGGFVTGIDGMISDGIRLGVLGGYSRSDFDAASRASSADVDSYHLGIYGGTQIDNIGIRAGASYTWHSIDTERSVNLAGFADSLSADYDAGTAQVFGEVGYAITAGTAVIEPFAGLAYVNLDVDSFGESGGAAALSSNGGSTDTTYSTLGLRASNDFDLGGQVVTTTGMLGWRHAFEDRDPKATLAFDAGSSFTVYGVPIAQDVAIVEVGVSTAIGEAASIGVSYNGQFGDGAEDNGARATFSYRF